MSKKWLKISAGVGFILILLFLNFWLNPGLVVTAQAQGQNPEQPPGLDSKSNLPPLERLKARGAVEIKELRTENSKTFSQYLRPKSSKNISTTQLLPFYFNPKTKGGRR